MGLNFSEVGVPEVKNQNPNMYVIFIFFVLKVCFRSRMTEAKFENDDSKKLNFYAL